jgi:hypothetical protein
VLQHLIRSQELQAGTRVAVSAPWLGNPTKKWWFKGTGIKLFMGFQPCLITKGVFCVTIVGFESNSIVPENCWIFGKTIHFGVNKPGM